MTVYRCDRCGDTFEERNENELNSVEIGHRKLDDEYITSEEIDRVDLCPNCMSKLLCWIDGAVREG